MPIPRGRHNRRSVSDTGRLNRAGLGQLGDQFTDDTTNIPVADQRRVLVYTDVPAALRLIGTQRQIQYLA
jgi:hypothetical protein